MKKIYEVTFETKVSGFRNWMVNVEADSSKEAKEAAEEMWYGSERAHMFRIHTRVVKSTEVIDYKHWFVEV